MCTNLDIRKILSLLVFFAFLANSLGPLPIAHADSVLGLPAPGTMINLSPAYEPVMIKGLTIHKDNPFLFDFIVDVGQDRMSGEPLKKEGEKLIKYFLASLAIPDKDVWVNLSPYEKNKMIPEALGQTDMGRDLLEQDYILKQITASLIYPEKQLGKTFWDTVYSKAREMYGTAEVPVNTFNKVWIMADRAEVYEHNQTAFVVGQHLKVMLEEDYLALTHHTLAKSHTIASQVVKQVILPELEKEVNTGKNFANLRQIFNSIILSSWYKKNLQQALLNQVYADKSKVKGIDLNDPTVKEQIYEQYLAAYKKGVFNYIKEDPGVDGAATPRKYFSGGIDEAMAADPEITKDAAALADVLPAEGRLVDLTTVASTQQGFVPDAAMASNKKSANFAKGFMRAGGSYTVVMPFDEAYVNYPIGDDNGTKIHIKRDHQGNYFIQNTELPGPVLFRSISDPNRSFIFSVENGNFVLRTKKITGTISARFKYQERKYQLGPGNEIKSEPVGQVKKRAVYAGPDEDKETKVSDGENITVQYGGLSISFSYGNGSLFLQKPIALNGGLYAVVFHNRDGQEIFQIAGRIADAVSIKDLSRGQSELFYKPHVDKAMSTSANPNKAVSVSLTEQFYKGDLQKIRYILGLLEIPGVARSKIGALLKENFAQPNPFLRTYRVQVGTDVVVIPSFIQEIYDSILERIQNNFIRIDKDFEKSDVVLVLLPAVISKFIKGYDAKIVITGNGGINKEAEPFQHQAYQETLDQPVDAPLRVRVEDRSKFKFIEFVVSPSEKLMEGMAYSVSGAPQRIIKYPGYQRSVRSLSTISHDLQGNLIISNPDEAMTSLQEDERDIGKQDDGIVSRERVSRLAGALQGKKTQIKLPYNESLEEFLGDQNAGILIRNFPNKIKQNEIVLWWEMKVGNRVIKKKAAVSRDGFIHIILNVLRKKPYLARLLIADLDPGLTGEELGQAAVGRLKKVDKKWLTQDDMEFILKLDRQQYFIDYDAIPRIYSISMWQDFISFYMDSTGPNRVLEAKTVLNKRPLGVIQLVVTEDYKKINSPRFFVIQAGLLQTLIADLFELDPETASRFVDTLKKQSWKNQAEYLSRQMDPNTVKELKIISIWLDEYKGSIDLPFDLGESMRQLFKKQNIRRFHHYPKYLDPESRFYYSDGRDGYWGFIGNISLFFIMLANLNLKDHVNFDELIGELLQDHPDLSERILNYYGVKQQAAAGKVFSIDAQIDKLKANLEENRIKWNQWVPQNGANEEKVRQSIEVTRGELTDLLKAVDDNEPLRAEKDKIHQAIELVFDKQGQSLRPDATFYPAHPLKAALNLINIFGITDPKFIIAALLHDFIEDVDEYTISPQLIGEMFGPDVQALVESVTNKGLSQAAREWLIENIFKPAGVDAQADQKAFDAVMKIIEFQIGVTSRILSDPDALILKSADFTDNAAIKQGDLDDNPGIKFRFLSKYRNLVPIFSQTLLVEATKEGYKNASATALITGLRKTGWLYKKRYDKLASYPRSWEYDDQLGRVTHEINTRFGGLGGLSRRFKGDLAMLGTPGGIDLNTSNGMQWRVSKDGKGVEMNVDPAMIARVRQEGIVSLSPVIIRMAPVTNIWSLVGLPKK